mgnify:FL=1
MTVDVKKLKSLCESKNIYLDENAEKRFEIYYNLLVSWNEKMNLTAITDPEGVLIKHFYDSLLFFKAAQVENGAQIIDVGTGAGFPGLVLKIARPDIKLTLLDGLNKRLTFLEAVLKETELDAELVHMRAEEGGKDKKYRERYDFATARAVKVMPVLCEYCLPFVKKGGNFIALKGATGKEELEASKNALKLLGGKTESVIEENLPEGDKRILINVKKISQTSPKYPRDNAKISKNPL